MNRNELITAIAEKTNMSKSKTEPIMDAVFEVITEALVSGENVKVMNFGTFKTKKRAERTGRNPQKNIPIIIPATTVPVFEFSDTVKKSVSVNS